MFAISSNIFNRNCEISYKFNQKSKIAITYVYIIILGLIFVYLGSNVTINDRVSLIMSNTIKLVEKFCLCSRNALFSNSPVRKTSYYQKVLFTQLFML